MSITPDSIPSSEQVRETFLDRIYYPYQKQILGGAALFGAVVIAFLALRWKHDVREDEIWNRYYRVQEAPAESPEAAREKVAELRAILQEHPEESVAPAAMRALVFAHEAAGQWDEAHAALEQLAAKHPDDDLFTVGFERADGGRQTFAEMHESLRAKELEWRASSTYAHPEPDTSRLAHVETTLGAFWIAFYPEHAEKHVEAFVARAKSGGFNGTQVFSIRRSTEDEPQLITAGSRASADPTDPREHDRDDPTHVIAPEPSRSQIRHVRGVVTAHRMSSGESDSAFAVITDPDGFRRYDGDTSPFGMVIDREGSFAALSSIAGAPTYGTNPDTKDMAGILSVREHPYPYVYIRRVTIYRDEKIEDGHTWDTSRAGRPEAEPWEAELPEPWKPVVEPPKKEEAVPPKDPKDDPKDDAEDAGKTEEAGDSTDENAPSTDK